MLNEYDVSSYTYQNTHKRKLKPVKNYYIYTYTLLHWRCFLLFNYGALNISNTHLFVIQVRKLDSGQRRILVDLLDLAHTKKVLSPYRQWDLPTLNTDTAIWTGPVSFVSSLHNSNISWVRRICWNFSLYNFNVANHLFSIITTIISVAKELKILSMYNMHTDECHFSFTLDVRSGHIYFTVCFCLTGFCLLFMPRMAGR